MSKRSNDVEVRKFIKYVLHILFMPYSVICGKFSKPLSTMDLRGRASLVETSRSPWEI